jgi:hypothetical protein
MLTRSPWHRQENAVLAAEAETPLERRLSQVIMRGGHGPKPSKVKAGAAIMTEAGVFGLCEPAEAGLSSSYDFTSRPGGLARVVA